MREQLTIVDLFCGCGGFSLGAELAGFKSIAAIDIDPTLQSAYRLNFPRSCAIEADVKDISRSDWRRVIGRRRPDGVIGGPPCQGFSWIGKKRPNDPRNSLIGEFIHQVSQLRPKFFVMENVEGLLHDGAIDVLRAAIDAVPSEYTVLEPIVINAADMGAATNRFRVALIGFDRAEVESTTGCEIRRLHAPRSTVRDAIADLPSPCSTFEQGDMGWAQYPRTSNLSKYAQTLRAPPPNGIGATIAVEQLKQGFVSGMKHTSHSAEIVRRYKSIKPGKSDPITKSYKLTWSGLSPTLRAGTGADRGAFQAVRPLHPEEGRVITVREAARIQGFPDWFLFHPTKWHSFRMIGNSVSPIVSQVLFEHLRGKMQSPIAT